MKSKLFFGILLYFLTGFFNFLSGQDNLKEMDFEPRMITKGLKVPWDLEWLGNDEILFTEIEGKIGKVNIKTGAKKTLYRLDDVARELQSGLLGMALHPDFNIHPVVYVAYTYYENDRILLRVISLDFQKKKKKLQFRATLVEGIPSNSTNIGGRLITTKDHKLLLTVGDRNREYLAQDSSSLNGKILRYNLDGSIPSDNPVAGSPVWAMGFRNPQGLVVANGSLYATEHGTFTDDEVNLIQPAGNYGWPEISGFCREESSDACVEQKFIDPLTAWSPTVAPCGLAYYEHSRIPALKNTLLVTTLKKRQLIALQLDSSGKKIQEEVNFLTKKVGRIRDILVNPEGRIFVSTSNKDVLGSQPSQGDLILELIPGKRGKETENPTKQPFNSIIQLDSTQLEIRVIAKNLRLPWDMVWGKDNWIWFNECEGTIKKLNPETGEIRNIHVIEEVFQSKENSGNHGLVFHPDYPEEPYLYTHYTISKRISKLVRFTLDPEKEIVVDTLVLLPELTAHAMHNGSRLVYSPDNKLFFALGDAFKKKTPQDRASYNGKILRMNPDGSVPEDNPFPGSLVWSYGHRNPQGLVFAPNGKLYSSEHGATNDDEINLIVKGGNYGWPYVEGFCDRRSEKSYCKENDVVEPLKNWTPTIAPAGLAFYDHPAIPEWRNSLLQVFLKGGDGEVGQRLKQMKLNETGDQIVEINDYLTYSFGRLRDVLVAPDGRVFVCTSNHNSSVVLRPGDDKIIEIRAIKLK